MMCVWEVDEWVISFCFLEEVKCDYRGWDDCWGSFILFVGWDDRCGSLFLVGCWDDRCGSLLFIGIGSKYDSWLGSIVGLFEIFGSNRWVYV